MTSNAHDYSGVQHTRSEHFFKMGFIRIAAVSLFTVSVAAGKCDSLDPANADPLALTARAVACLSSGDLKSAEAMQSRTVSILNKRGAASEVELAGAWNLLGIIQRQAARLPNAEHVGYVLRGGAVVPALGEHLGGGANDLRKPTAHARSAARFGHCLHETSSSSKAG